MSGTDHRELLALVERTADALVLVAGDGRIVWASPAVRGHLGHNPEDTVGMDALDFVHPEDRALAEHLFDAVVEGHKPDRPTPIRARNADGDWRWIEALANRVSGEGDAEVVLSFRDVTERVEAERRLSDREAWFRALAENSAEGFLTCDEDGIVTYASPTVAQILGFAPEELVGLNGFDLVHPEDLALANRQVRALRAQPGERVRTTIRVRHRSGTYRYVTATSVDHIADSAIRSIVVNFHDATDQRMAEDAVRSSEAMLRASEARFRAVVDNSYDVMVVVDAEATIKWVTPPVRTLFGYEPDELVGVSGFDLVHPDDRETMAEQLAEFVAGEGVPRPMTIRLRHRDGTWRYADIVATDLLANPDIAGLALNIRVVDERVESEGERQRLVEILEHAASHDPLTGLPNRTLLLDRLEMSLARVGRTHGSVAVMFVDLDNFKVLNDSLGHSHGDELLVRIARRLQQVVRPEDTVARFGGDEFVLLCEGVSSEEEARPIIRRIDQATRGPFTIRGSEVTVGVSIGIAFATEATSDAEVLIRDADAAMYRAKERGRGRFEIFDQAMRTAAVTRLDTERALRRAVDRLELRVYYQPIVALASDRVVGLEALLRWAHPERGLLEPRQFLSVAEETGMIVPIGSWVIEQACWQLRSWSHDHPELEGTTMAINLSSGQLEHPRLVDLVDRAVTITDLDPSRLHLEVTEQVVMRDVTRSVQTLHQLKDLGVTLAIDDFGTGYSSLSNLRRLPVDVLKVDRSFVEGLGRDDRDLAIVETIIQLAHTLGLTALAEGVEDDQQLEALRALDCDLVQGFLISEPVSADQVPDLMCGGAGLS